MRKPKLGEVDWPEPEWVCECGATGVRAVRGEERLEVYGKGWLYVNMAVRCTNCPDSYRYAPTIGFIATPGQEVPKELRGERTAVVVDDEEEFSWGDEDDDVEWDDETDDVEDELAWGFSMHDYGDR